MPTSVTETKARSDRIIREFAEELRRRLGERVQQIVLYGSRARGDFWDGSDFDVIVVVDRQSRELEDLVLDVEGEFLDHYEVLISSIVRNREDWRQEIRYPFGAVVEREGVQV